MAEQTEQNARPSRKLGCIGAILVLGLAVVAAFAGGQLLFVGLEVLALAFTRIGIEDPALAWGLTGLVLGALVGAVVGLRRVGRTHQFWELGLAVALVSGLAFLGATAAGEYVRVEAMPSAVLFGVEVVAEELNVRPAPSLGNEPLTTVVRGQRLDVVDTTPDWYAVRFEQDGRSYEGWISSAYTTRTGGRSSPSRRPRERGEADPQPPAPAPDTGHSVPLLPSATVPVRTAQGRLDAQVLGGSAVSVPEVDETRVALRVQERSYNVAGAWTPWTAIARASYLTDGRATYRASVTESTGPGGDTLPGRSRQGTLVVYVPVPPDDVSALTLVYTSGDASPAHFPLDGRSATQR